MRFYTFACHSNVRLGKVSLVFLMSEIVERDYFRIFQFVLQIQCNEQEYDGFMEYK